MLTLVLYVTLRGLAPDLAIAAKPTPCPKYLTESKKASPVDDRFKNFHENYKAEMEFYRPDRPGTIVHDNFVVKAGRDVMEALENYVFSKRFETLAREPGNYSILESWTGESAWAGRNVEIWRRSLQAKFSTRPESQSVALGPGMPMFAITTKPQHYSYDGFGKLTKLLAAGEGTVHLMHVGGLVGFKIPRKNLPKNWRRRFAEEIEDARRSTWADESHPLELIAGPSSDTAALLRRIQAAGAETIEVRNTVMWSVLFHVQPNRTVNVFTLSAKDTQASRIGFDEAVAANEFFGRKSIPWTVVVRERGRDLPYLHPAPRRRTEYGPITPNAPSL